MIHYQTLSVHLIHKLCSKILPIICPQIAHKNFIFYHILWVSQKYKNS